MEVNKIFSLDNIPFEPNTVTYVSGYYDLLHAGHVEFLRECRNVGNPLVVGLMSHTISKKQGRPILSDDERIIVLSELMCVDYVFINTVGFDQKIIEQLLPKAIVFSEGEPPSKQKLNDIAFLETTYPFIDIIYIPRQRYDVSTTQIIERIKSSID